MAEFSGKVVAVSGGASGIGAEICSQLAEAGADVYALDLRGEHPQVPTISVDVADSAAVRDAIDAIGLGVDILVHGAAVAEAAGLHEMTDAEWQRERAIALDGGFYLARAVLPAMIARRAGVIINIGSVNGHAAYGQPSYSAAKAGLESLTQNLAVRYGPFGIRANAVAPGTVRTPAWRSREESNPAIFDQLARWYPMGRVGLPEDVAHAVLFLASDRASWITGTTLTVDGGLTAGGFRMISTAVGADEW
ncbi:SDR family NAD(P)-dependent oxidoreductase [Ruania zhangjianzhongii]|uniref:SDR family NAD(P)-dependent oxidoreductase n=1 Tax=Ruania zhangjianzhongii TaxID=2603206 RepID=UPI001AEF3931|nr:SDR family oxidoreductase [Ruania zhangjianzhongii]